MSYEISFKEGLPYDCTCAVCEQALRGPVITKCEHTFCKQCLDLSNGQIPCPTCQSPIEPDSLKPDKKKHIQVQSLLVKCPFVRFGCEWTGPLKEMQKHAENCDWQGVPCSNCNKLIAQRELNSHLSECQKTRGKCSYCNMMVKTASMEKHLKICPKMIISCPFQCGLMDRTREEIEEHRASCPNVDNACPFAELGCTYIGDKTTVQQHLAEEPIRHLMYLCDEVTDLKNYHIMEQMELSKINDRHEDLLRRAITANEMFGPQLVWRIENVAQRKNEARSGTRPVIYSEPFVTGRHGYKMVASACLFGDGPYRGKFMAVYLTLMKGKYDSLLEWPFEHTVCITLLDQEKTDFLQRPLNEKNGSFGAQTFCRLEVMDTFVRDDVMFLKVEIDVVKPIEHVPPEDPPPHTLQSLPTLRPPTTRSGVASVNDVKVESPSTMERRSTPRAGTPQKPPPTGQGPRLKTSDGPATKPPTAPHIVTESNEPPKDPAMDDRTKL
ncbi:hypothetical protein Q1695_014028 [Nippostrongylus brasiliensis]|nr:hypothetical protein Q1695_014028 [Nippostrongylus brasiliensis]